jgi:hypothetical protein
MTLPASHPEYEALKRRHAEAREALRSALDEWHRMSTEIRPHLTHAYATHFGELERELQFKALESAELFRRVELLSIKVARGEKLTPEIIDLVNTVVDREYAKFRRRVREAFDMDAEQRERSAVRRETGDDDEELVKLYRTLVKRMHPDAAGANAPGTEAWHTMQNAYRDRNVSQLRALMAVLGVEDGQGADTSSWDLERWTVETDLLERRLDVERRKLERLRRQEPFTYALDLEDASWRERHAAELRKAIAAKDKEIAENREHYREITGGDVPSGTDVVRSAEEQTFDEDFMKNTYFGQR